MPLDFIDEVKLAADIVKKRIGQKRFIILKSVVVHPVNIENYSHTVGKNKKIPEMSE